MKNDILSDGGKYLDAGILNMGNTARLRSVLFRAKAGERITLGFFGGSITQGAGSGSEKCYAEHVTDALRERFPDCEIKYINAGLGATGSALGAFRVREDILCHKPDIMIVDHSVNDNGDESKKKGSTKQTYEGVIRLALMSGAAVLPLCVCNSAGVCQEEIDLEIARHYKLPFISMKSGIFEPLIASGKHEWSEYAGDGVHPNPTGHKMLSELIINYVDKVISSGICESEPAMPNYIHGDLYMDTEFLSSENFSPDDMGAFEAKSTDFWQFKGGFTAFGKGKPMTFTLKGVRAVRLAYLRAPSEEYGRANVKVGGNTYLLNSAFAGGWGRYAETAEIFFSENPTDVSIGIEPLDEGRIFSLLRIMVAK